MTKNLALIAYHDGGGCIDGFTSAWVTQKALKERGMDIRVLPMNYNEESYQELEDQIRFLEPSEVYIVDFSIPLEVMTEIDWVHPNMDVVILDHHKTAFELYDPETPVVEDSNLVTHRGNCHIILDMTKSGAGICWDYFYRPLTPLPKLVSYVQDYDLWRFDFGDETRYVNKYLKNMTKEFGIWDALAQQMEDFESMTDILDRGKDLQKEHDEVVASIVLEAYYIDIDGVQGYMVPCPRTLASDVGNLLAKIEDSHFGLTFTVNPAVNGLGWSIRGNGDTDVSAIAKKYGGGGHFSASGFTTPLLPDTNNAKEAI